MSVEQLPLKCIHIHNNLITRSKSLDESVLDTPGLRFGSLRRQPDTLLQLKDHLLKHLEQRNSQHNHWGWKYPNAAAYLPLILERVRNPRLICILRDPLASSSRELRADAIQQQGNEERRLRQAMRAINTNIDLMHENDHPTLMVSYEKAIQKPAPFVRALALFLGIEPTAQAIDAALGQIQPGGYLQG